MSAGGEPSNNTSTIPTPAQGVAENPSSSNDVLSPKATLYVANIDWSIKKNVLRRALLALFERHGKVLEVVTLRREGLRGQAWILFEDIASAIAAQRTENGFVFFGKALKVQFARETSDRIAKRDGTYVPKDRRVKKIKSEANSSTPNEQNVETNAATTEDPPPSSSLMNPSPTNPTQSHPPTSTSTSSSKSEPAPPSNILFAQNLPEECNEMMLAMLFRQYVGYQQIRMPRSGLAFIEFESEPNATLALKGLNGFQITSNDTLNLEYSR